MRYVLRQKMLSFADAFQVRDEQGEVAFTVAGKVFSLGKQLTLQDAEGNALISIKQRLLSFRPTYELLQEDAILAVVEKELFNVFSYRFSIDVTGAPSLEATGNFLDHEYLISCDGRSVATVSKKWFSLTDTYGVDIGAGQDNALILAIAVVIDMICHPDQK